jgi:hypothetical protein
MSLEVETGSGSTTAESYASVAEATSYHSRFGNTAWAAATEPQQEIALRKATRYIDGEYGSRWGGRRTNQNQALDWPRSFVYEDEFYQDATSIPQRLKDATSIMALAALAEDIYPDIGEDDGSVKMTRVKVGPIEIEDEFIGGAKETKFYRSVDDLLSRFITSGGMVNRG